MAWSGCEHGLTGQAWLPLTPLQIPAEDREEVNATLLRDYQCYPVYLSDDLADRHYNGFSNSILWPLFHYHPGEMNFDESHWLAYR
jgi:trehalose 6-phosphate synthase